MSSALKHMARSHRNHSNNAYIFSRFEVTASKIKDAKKLRTLGKKVTLKDRIKKLFKHQDR
jgi:hypothetical protein